MNRPRKKAPSSGRISSSRYILDRVEDVNPNASRRRGSGGGGIAQVSTELINAGVRWTANWSGKDSVGLGRTLTSCRAHRTILIGLAVYLTELLMRPKGELPSMR